MVKGLVKFVFLLTLISHNVHTSDKNFLTDLPKPVFSKIVEFLDIQSIGRMLCLSKPIQAKIVDLKKSLKGKHTILDLEHVQLLETCMSDFMKQNKENKKSISPFLFSAFLIERANQNQNLRGFMEQFMNTILHENKDVLIEWQSKMIWRKMLSPFFEKIIKKKKKQKWETIFERDLFEYEDYLETRHPYYILPFIFFLLDKHVSVNYEVRNSFMFIGATVIEFVAGAGFYNLVDFLLKKGAQVNRIDSSDSCLYLSLTIYTSMLANNEDGDEACRTVCLLLDHGANKDHFISFSNNQTIRQYVKKNVSDPKILKYFEDEN